MGSISQVLQALVPAIQLKLQQKQLPLAASLLKVIEEHPQKPQHITMLISPLRKTLQAQLPQNTVSLAKASETAKALDSILKEVFNLPHNHDRQYKQIEG